MAGNFSSIAREYVNSKGESVFLNNEGLRDNGEFALSEVRYYDVGEMYERSLWFGDSSPGATGGYSMTIYPIGVEVPYVPTDTTKIRIAYGQADPMSEEEIYTKK